MLLYTQLRGDNMTWKNKGLKRFENANVETFTTSRGIKLRKLMHPLFKTIVYHTAPGKIVVDSYPKLDPKKQYVFAATHSCIREPNALLGTIDRSVYTLCGTLDQFEHNPEMYMQWLMGVIIVDRFNQESREAAQFKELRILKEGSSFMEFPEGGLNNSENLLISPLCSGGVYWVPQGITRRKNNEDDLSDDIIEVDSDVTDKKIEVVPISVFNNFGEKKLYVRAGEPLKLYEYDKEEAMTILRDSMATLMWDHYENHAPRIRRCDLPETAREDFMKERALEYLQVHWTDKEALIKELYVRYSLTPKEVRASLDSVKITRGNAYSMAPIMAPILKKRAEDMEDMKYDLGRYISEHWEELPIEMKKFKAKRRGRW